MAPALIAIIFVVELILAAGHLFVYKTTTSLVIFSHPGTLYAVRGIFVFLSLSFVAASLIAFRYYNRLSRAFYVFAAAWLGFLWYAIMACVVFFVSVGLFGVMPPSRGEVIYAEILACVAVAAAGYGLYHAARTKVTRYSVAVPHLPPAWRGKRAVLLADFHLGQVRGEKFAARIVSQVNALNADIILVAGDVFDGVRVPAREVAAPFSALRPAGRVYFVTGNHEEFGDNGPYIAAMKDAGVRVLMNEAVVVDGFKIVGVADRDSARRESFEDILPRLTAGAEPVLLLKHQPNHLDVAARSGVSIQLSGHTHRAQIFPFYYIERLIFKGYEYGLHPFGSMTVCTTSGVGTWGAPPGGGPA